MFRTHPEVTKLLDEMRLYRWTHPSEDSQFREIEEFVNESIHRATQEFYIAFIGSPYHRVQDAVNEFKAKEGREPKFLRVGKQLREEMIRLIAGEDLGSQQRSRFFTNGLEESHPYINGMRVTWYSRPKAPEGKTWDTMTGEEKQRATEEAEANDTFLLE